MLGKVRLMCQVQPSHTPEYGQLEAQLREKSRLCVGLAALLLYCRDWQRRPFVSAKYIYASLAHADVEGTTTFVLLFST